MVNSEFFSLETDPKLACGCCGTCDLVPGLLEKLDVARSLAGVPFTINSGFRCPEHNADIGSKPTSSHVGGYAVDIATGNGPERAAILKGLIMAGFERIGIAKSFIHVDIDPDKLNSWGPVTWVYS
ncbi:D-Ala-D-Ala carboxypeptidase family metallohydrolase [Maridesulfovibrio ferrireducens]|uniref:D-Ala-D-Ala carboxypeptidase family metallohydrolase n=1 Tax=Maridesulfovibrio ferrireducens TaxID=246191 RepID=UPI001A1FADE3|nr:D-Ala-D-Ala carboxypeptidase family metallohydrolase [Maridesulfovibrio ferrireducens]MBI9110108.1 peptidase M15 [Maridesulfovibrio ferrireducens]